MGEEDWLAKESDTDSHCGRKVSSIASLALVLGSVNSDVSVVSTHLHLPMVACIGTEDMLKLRVRRTQIRISKHFPTPVSNHA